MRERVGRTYRVVGGAYEIDGSLGVDDGRFDTRVVPVVGPG